LLRPSTPRKSWSSDMALLLVLRRRLHNFTYHVM
jgi:hypothetical protein